MSENEKTEATLDLAQPRVIVLDDRGHKFTLHCRRITADDWMKYFSAITVTAERDGRDQERIIDLSSARLQLADAVLESAEGYQVAGGVKLDSLPEWRKRIPLAHRRRLGDVLTDARVALDADDLMIHPEGEAVYLDATWGAAEGGGVMKYSGLKHVFQTPSEAHHTRFERESSRTRIVGGSRTGKTIYPATGPLLAKLYDELILEVNGYSLGGRELADRATVIREMDVLHKVTAAEQIFHPQSTVTLDEGDDE
jgi:hypothetical protein